MPKRTNLFQQVVGIVYDHMADGAVVEESALLRDSRAGETREVDVVIRGEVAGEVVVVSVEAVARKRKADLTWVDSMLSKHHSLPTNKLILVSEAGFSKGAAKKAKEAGAVPVTPEKFSEADTAGEIVNRLDAIWSKTHSIEVGSVEVEMLAPDGSELFSDAPPDVPFYSPDGTVIGLFSDLVSVIVRDYVGPQEIAERVGLRDITESVEKKIVLAVDFPAVAVPAEPKTMSTPVYVRPDNGDPESPLLSIKRMVIRGVLKIDVAEIPLSHQRIGDAGTAHGSATIDGSKALFVVTEGEHGSKATIRLEDGRIAQLKRPE